MNEALSPEKPSVVAGADITKDNEDKFCRNETVDGRTHERGKGERFTCPQLMVQLNAFT